FSLDLLWCLLPCSGLIFFLLDFLFYFITLELEPSLYLYRKPVIWPREGWLWRLCHQSQFPPKHSPTWFSGIIENIFSRSCRACDQVWKAVGADAMTRGKWSGQQENP
ncbi:Exportin-5, partial [Manis pentadactyla]